MKIYFTLNISGPFLNQPLRIPGQEALHVAFLNVTWARHLETEAIINLPSRVGPRYHIERYEYSL